MEEESLRDSTDRQIQSEYAHDLDPADEPDLAEELIEQSRLRRRRMKRVVGVVLSLALFINVLSVWPAVLNWTAVDFLRTSYRLYQNQEMRDWKRAVVSVVGEHGKGTGFNIHPSGLIVTNFHVIADRKGLYVHFPAGDSLIPSGITAMPTKDLALLKIKAKNLPYLTPNFDYVWRKGEKVTFIGNPLGFPSVANEGKLLGETKVKGIEGEVMMIQAPVYKGNSGSPVFNREGEIIGVIFATVSQHISKKEEKIGLAIPIRYLINQLSDFSHYKKKEG